MDILLTFTGFHDPYSKGLIDQEEQPGPILSLLSTRAFDNIFLFDGFPEDTEDSTFSYGQKACQALATKLASLTPQGLPITEHEAILELFGAEVKETDSYSLIGCTVAPGFEFEDFERARRESLVSKYPAHRDIIIKLT